MTFLVGDSIRVHRDETIRPSRGTWRRYREQCGFVVMVGDDEEYGVILSTTRPPWRKDPGSEGQLSYDSAAVLWFREYELIPR